MQWYILFRNRRTGKYPQVFGRPKEHFRPKVKLRFYNALTRFRIIDGFERGILERNPDYSGNPNHTDPTKRYPFRFLERGQYIEADAERNYADESVDNPSFWYNQFTEDEAESATYNTYKAPLELRSTWQSRNPNIVLGINRHEGDTSYVTKTVKWSDQYTENGVYRLPPWGTFYLKTDDYEGFITPDGEESTWSESLAIFLQGLNPGLYSLSFSTDVEASGGVGTTNRPTGGAIIAGSEYQYFESVDNVFFSPWDLSDRNTFKVTTNPYYNGPETEGPFLKIDKHLFQHWDIYLVPRRWLYFFRFIATYMVVTAFTFWYHYIAYAGTFFDIPPWHPYPFGELEYPSPAAGFIDYGCYCKLVHSQEFYDKLSLATTYSYANPFFAILWIGNSNFYFRVRCTPDKEGYLCAIIVDRTAGDKTYYVWRKVDEDRELITMVDGMVFFV